MAGMRLTIYADLCEQAAIDLTAAGRARIAEDIAAEARADAPIETGSFESHFFVEERGTEVAVGNDDPAAAHIVLGTSDTPPHPGLLNAARRRGRYTPNG